MGQLTLLSGTGTGVSDELFKFSTGTMIWMQLDEDAGVTGMAPSARLAHSMTTVGQDIYIWGGQFRASYNNEVSDELFKYSTASMMWMKLEAAASVTGTSPSPTSGHSMTTLGQHIYIFGGRSPSDNSFGGKVGSDFFYHQASDHMWTSSFGLSSFTRIYDNDLVRVAHDVNWGFSVDLCSSTILPCALRIAAEGAFMSNTIVRRLANSTITCDAGKGCTGFSMDGVTVSCSDQISKLPLLQVLGSGATVTIADSGFEGCSSETDGGVIRVIGGGVINVSGSSFVSSSSKSSGGAMAVVGAHASIVHSYFTDSRATEGGALFVQNFPSYPNFLPSSVRLQGCVFSRNAAYLGGAIAVIDSGQAKISESRFQDTQAFGFGGGALYASSSSVELAANFFLRNSAAEGGGGALLWNGKQGKALMTHDVVASRSLW